MTLHPLFEFLYAMPSQKAGFSLIKDRHFSPWLLYFGCCMHLRGNRFRFKFPLEWTRPRRQKKANEARRLIISATVLDTTSLLRRELMAAIEVFKVELRGGLRIGKTQIPLKWSKPKSFFNKRDHEIKGEKKPCMIVLWNAYRNPLLHIAEPKNRDKPLFGLWKLLKFNRVSTFKGNCDCLSR